MRAASRGPVRPARLGLPAAVVCAGLIGALTITPAQGASPTPTVWPEPGDGVATAQPLTIGGRSGSVQVLRKPLILVEKDVEKGPVRSFSINTDVLFATGSHTLSAEAGEALDELVKQLKDSGMTGPAKVIGHTDDVGSDADNLTLSQRRAKTVLERLEPELKYSRITLSATGVGESQPLVKGTDDRSRARNRRVSVVFKADAKAPAARSDRSDISVSPLQPAPPAPESGAPEGSIVSTQRTLRYGTDDRRYEVRLDVTRAEPIGGGMLALELEVLPVSGSSDFFNLAGVFSGRIGYRDPAPTVIYDRAAARSLPPVVNGEGKVLGSGYRSDGKVGEPRHVWFIMPMPEQPSPTLELYVPAFGVLNVPVAQG